MNNNPAEFIEGAAQVVAHFGDWPVFHDSQPLSVDLDCVAGTLEVTFDLLDAGFPDDRTTILALQWEGITDLKLASTRLDGVLYGLVLCRTKGGTETQLMSNTGGIIGQILANSVKVTRYEPGEE